MTLRETSCTFAEARATAVSAMISACTEPRPPVTLRYSNRTQTTTLNIFEYYADLSYQAGSGLLLPHLDETVENHVEQVAHNSDVAPDLGLYGRVHLHLVDGHRDELVQNQVHFLSLRLV